MTPDEYCQNKAARSGSSFYYSFLFLPPERRRAITALYAYCREVDDTVDEATDPQVARARLDWWRAEIERLFAGDPQHPVTRAMAPHLAPCAIDRASLVAIIDGMQMDLEQDRYADFEGLRLYCHRVAGVVGVLAAGIFGARSAGTLAYAEQLGLAFQLTNIVRDVGEDARKGRRAGARDPRGAAERSFRRADALRGRTRPRLLPAGVRAARTRRASRAASWPDDGRDLRAAARRDRARRLPGADPSHLPHPGAQALARLEDLGDGPATPRLTPRVPACFPGR
jgi:phytoene synthase